MSSKIKVIEESRFMSRQEMDNASGGIKHCSSISIYTSCDHWGYTICGGIYDMEYCYNLDLTCIDYVSCAGTNITCGEDAYRLQQEIDFPIKP